MNGSTTGLYKLHRDFRNKVVSISINKCISVDLVQKECVYDNLLEFTARIRIAREDESGIWVCSLLEHGYLATQSMTSDSD